MRGEKETDGLRWPTLNCVSEQSPLQSNIRTTNVLHVRTYVRTNSTLRAEGFKTVYRAKHLPTRCIFQVPNMTTCTKCQIKLTEHQTKLTVGLPHMSDKLDSSRVALGQLTGSAVHCLPPSHNWFYRIQLCALCRREVKGETRQPAVLMLNCTSTNT